MGNKNSGPKPQATALRILRGNPGKRPINEDEPQVPRAGEDFDVPPVELDGDEVACAEWARTAPILRVAGIVSDVERGSLIACCQQWSRYVEAHDRVRKNGMIVAKPSGIPMVNPFMAVEKTALDTCIKLWQELGLTPSSRTRLTALPADDVAPMSKWAGLL